MIHFQTLKKFPHPDHVPATLTCETHTLFSYTFVFFVSAHNIRQSIAFESMEIRRSFSEALASLCVDLLVTHLN